MTGAAAGKGFRVTLVNPPFRRPVMRRYVASYFAPNFLLPPADLLYVSAAARRFAGAHTVVVDAVAKKMNAAAALAAVAETRPEVVFVQLGFATLADDLQFCTALGSQTGAPVVAMGYLPTVFGREIMAASTLDILIRGEPEIAFSQWLLCRQEGKDPAGIAGVMLRQNGGIVVGPPPERIADLDALPFPDHYAVDLHDYSEALLGRPVAAIFTARGCPHSCNFCVRTYGRRLVMRSAASVLAEAEHVVRNLGVRNLRFMDDTLNVNPERVLSICAGLEKLAPLRWTALARLDQLSRPVVEAMARSGCRRLYVGVESASERLLDFYKKNISVNTMREGIRLIRAAGLEASAFFIVGGPEETREEFEASVRFAQETNLDFIIVTRLQYWPDTELFAQTKNISTSIVPFYCRPADEIAYDRLLDLEREFYRRFYLRPAFILRRLRRLLKNPRELWRSAFQLGRYILARGKEDFI